jgi:hypothetical protein
MTEPTCVFDDEHKGTCRDSMGRALEFIDPGSLRGWKYAVLCLNPECPELGRCGGECRRTF